MPYQDIAWDLPDPFTIEITVRGTKRVCRDSQTCCCCRRQGAVGFLSPFVLNFC